MDYKWGLTARGICEFENKYLLLKIRTKSPHDAGKWEIPGGKVKKGEFFDEALKREYIEETGLKINVDDLINVVKNDYMACKTKENIKSIQLIMKVTCKNNKVIISEEHEDYGWFSLKEIHNMIDSESLTKPAINAFSNLSKLKH